MTRTSTTLCHPKIGYVNAMLLFRSRHLAINSPLGHFNGDNAHSPLQKYQTHETHGDIQSSFSSNGNMAFVELQRTQSITRLTTRAAISTFSISHNSIFSQYNLSTRLAAQKAKPIFQAANKTYSKTFRL